MKTNYNHGKYQFGIYSNSLFITVCGCILASLGGTAYGQPIQTQDVMKRGVAEEQKFTTAKLSIESSEKCPQFSEADFNRLLMSSDDKKSIKSLQASFNNTPIIKDMVIDNNRNKLLVRNRPSSDGSNSRTLFSKDSTKSYIKFRGVNGGRDVYVRPAQWPPEEPVNIWRLRYFTFKQSGNLSISLLSYDSNTGQVIIDIKPKNDKKSLYFRERVWVDLKNHCTVPRYQLLSSDNFVELDSIRSFKLYPNGIVYPDSITETRYYRVKTGNPLIYLTTKVRVLSAEINVPVSDADLDFGLYPKGARVVDTRFNPALNYNQGDKQYTDSELSSFSKNPDLLPYVPH